MNLKALVKKIVPHGVVEYRQLRKARKPIAQIAKVLSDERPFDTRRAEADFDFLMDQYPVRDEYGYDLISLAKRAGERLPTLVEKCILLDRKLSELTVLEVGCGDALVSRLLAALGAATLLTDIEDWRHECCKSLPLHIGPLEAGLPYSDHSVDFMFSYNTFEHLADPVRCWDAVVRVVRPGGLIYIDFNPAYCSPWGLHAYRMLRMPYPQFLFSDAFLMSVIGRTGVRDLGKKLEALQPLNRWKLTQFDQLWLDPRVEVIEKVVQEDWSHVNLILKYPECFRGRGLKVEDVVGAGVRVTLRRR